MRHETKNKREYETKKASKAKKVIISLTIIFASTLIGLLLVEVILRIFMPQQEALRCYKTDKKYGFVLKKNFYQKYSYLNSDFIMEIRTNSLGHRDEERDISKSQSRRILLLGDSFLFGRGVNMEDHFAPKLERLLNNSGKDYIVINAGVDSWGTKQELLYAKDNFETFQPEIIVLIFCGNDPDDDIRFLNNMVDFERGLFYFPGKIFLRNNSYLYRFIYNRYHRRLIEISIKKKIRDNPDPGLRTLIDDQSGQLITEEQWSMSLKYINDFFVDFKRFNPDGFLLVLATAPWNNDIRNHLSSLSNSKNLLYLDLYNETNILPQEKRRLPHDGHWSILMHSIVAKKLAATIEDICTK